MSTRILAIDDHDVVLLGLQEMFAGTNMRIVATAKSTAGALKHIGKHKPDVVLTEVRFGKGDGDGVAMLKEMKSKSPGLPVLIFTAFDEPIYRSRTFAWGAAGYVLKHDPPSRLLEAIRQVARGEPVWTECQLKQIQGRVVSDPSVSLTERESEVHHLLAHGLSNEEIALILGIGYDTVKGHVQYILRKLGMGHRTQAAVWVTRKELARTAN